MNKSNIKGNVILIITALIWGTAFVAQSVGMDYVGPFTFITARYIVGGLFLIPCIYLLDKMNKKTVKNLVEISGVRANFLCQVDLRYYICEFTCFDIFEECNGC